MSTPVCILSGVPITADNDSRAHVIPSALGGRLKPMGLLTDDANGELNDKVDLPLIQAMQPLMVWLGGSRDSGKTPSIRMKDENGRAYEVNFNEPLRLSAPEFKMEETEEGARIEIAVRTTKELRTILGRVKKVYPTFDIEEAVQRHHVVREPLHGWLHKQLQIGPNVVFPAAFVAASIFAAHHKQARHPLFQSYVQGLDAEADRSTIAMPPDTFYWHTDEAWASIDAEVAHVVAFVGDAARQQAICCVDYFGVASVATVLPYAAATDFTSVYAVDVIEGGEAAATINAGVFANSPWRATHHLGDAALYTDVTDRFNRFMAIAQGRARSHALDALIEETLGPADGRPLTEDDIDKLSNKLASFIAGVAGG